MKKDFIFYLVLLELAKERGGNSICHQFTSALPVKGLRRKPCYRHFVQLKLEDQCAILFETKLIQLTGCSLNAHFMPKAWSPDKIFMSHCHCKVLWVERIQLRLLLINFLWLEEVYFRNSIALNNYDLLNTKLLLENEGWVQDSWKTSYMK